MKIYFYSTPHFDPIRIQFINSIKDNWDLNEFKFENFSTQNHIGGGLSSAFSKMSVIFSAFEQTLNNEIFLVSDIDILFYSKCTEIILEHMENNHICFSRELCDSGINIGFMAIKNTKETRFFWKDIYERIQKRDIPIKEGGSKELNKVVDQFLINILLNENSYPDLKWSLLPTCFWNWSQGGLNKNIVLHHANCTRGLDEKIKQFEYVKKFMQEN